MLRIVSVSMLVFLVMTKDYTVYKYFLAIFIMSIAYHIECYNIKTFSSVQEINKERKLDNSVSYLVLSGISLFISLCFKLVSL